AHLGARADELAEGLRGAAAERPLEVGGLDAWYRRLRRARHMAAATHAPAGTPRRAARPRRRPAAGTASKRAASGATVSSHPMATTSVARQRRQARPMTAPEITSRTR